jgi:hypothetical protein
VAEAYNPTYLGGRDQEDHHFRPAWEKSSQLSHPVQAGHGAA